MLIVTLLQRFKKFFITLTIVALNIFLWSHSFIMSLPYALIIINIFFTIIVAFYLKTFMNIISLSQWHTCQLIITWNVTQKRSHSLSYSKNVLYFDIYLPLSTLYFHILYDFIGSLFGKLSSMHFVESIHLLSF